MFEKQQFEKIKTIQKKTLIDDFCLLVKPIRVKTREKSSRTMSGIFQVCRPIVAVKD